MSHNTVEVQSLATRLLNSPLYAALVGLEQSSLEPIEQGPVLEKRTKGFESLRVVPRPKRIMYCCKGGGPLRSVSRAKRTKLIGAVSRYLDVELAWMSPPTITLLVKFQLRGIAVYHYVVFNTRRRRERLRYLRRLPKDHGHGEAWH